jgi:SAM-dependent methyltransferase
MMAMACRSCGNHNVEMFLDLGPQPHCNRLVKPGATDPPSYPLRVGYCHDCTLVQIDTTIPKELMFADYPYVSATTATLAAHFRKTADRLASTYHVNERDLVVDIGCNDGTFLAQWQAHGCRTVGVDPAVGVAGTAFRPQWLIEDFFDKGCAEDIVNNYGHAKIVTAAGVFFHLEELHSVCDGVAHLIGDDGVLVVQAIYLGAMLENTAFDQIYHEHLCYYTLRSLDNLVRRHGMQVFEASRHSIHGGTLEAHICRAGARNIGSSVEHLSRAERIQNLDRSWPYFRFGDAVKSVRGELRHILARYREEGRSVWAYGAPAKGATLLNSFTIGRELVQCAVEKNPRKVGTEIPGCRIPIVAESDARPDAFLMLAWNFLPEFIEKERAFLHNGGEMIVPVPWVRVIRGAD